MKTLKNKFKQSLKHLYEDNELDIIFKMMVQNLTKENQIFEGDLNETALNLFDSYTQKLQNQIPIQQVLGEADFYNLKFKVTEDVLIPRPETEELVQLVVQQTKNKTVNILDVGTGSGCIAVSLKKNLPLTQVYGLDISEKALAIAKENADLNRIEVNFILDDALNLDAAKYPFFDVIVSNPPYIAKSEMLNMDANVTAHEPHLALFVPDNDPLIFYHRIADFALSNLKKEGFLFFEINQALGQETKDLLTDKGFNATLMKDINQNDRIIMAQLLG